MYMWLGTNMTIYINTDLSTAFDLSTASYNNVNFSASAQTILLTDVNFNSRWLYRCTLLGWTLTRFINIISLKAFDVSTSYSTIMSALLYLVSAERPFSVIFNPDGTKMYILQDSPGVIYQYNLSTAFNVSTATYDNVSFSVASQEAIAMGVVFSTDGTKMYMVGNSTDSVYQYTLVYSF